MPLRVKTLVEPATERSRSIKPILADSDEYYFLYRDLQRYTADEISGRSYLIAGHRGSGKTILVHSAVEELWRNSQGLGKRPLLIRLYGPDLLPKRENAQSQSAAHEGNATPTNQIAIAFSGDSPASVSTFQPRTPKEEGESDFENVLVQLTKGLVRDVTNEFRRCFRDAVMNTTGLGRKRHDLLELAAQLELEVSESTNPGRLRSFWQRIGKLQDGVLFQPPKEDHVGYSLPRRTDAGIQEILVLAFVSQAYQVVSGKIEEKEKQTDAAKQQEASAVSTAYALKDVLAPIIGLITGGTVGVALGINGNAPLTSVALGLLAGGAVSFGFSFSSARTRSKETTLESIFIRDRSVTTLSSAIPLLIRRLKAIGLAPIFVVDEMDKVEDLEVRMPNLIHHFKYLLTENSFFCFLADRRYLTYHIQQAGRSAYAPEYTYFSNALLVLYKPKELRAFVEEALESIAPIQAQTIDPEVGKAKDTEDMQKIAYILLHRARLHPMELRREIDRLAYRGSFSIADFRDGYTFEIFIQLAVESIVESADVQRHIDARAHNRQLVYDALYYVSRLWECASDGASHTIPGFEVFEGKKPGFVLDEAKFTKYMQSRYAEEGDKKKTSESQAESRPETQERDNAADFRYLFGLVKDLLNRLSSPAEFQKDLFSRQAEHGIPSYVLNVIPKTPPFRYKGNQYFWLYDVSGRSFVTGEIRTLLGELGSPIANIEAADQNIRSLGVEDGLQILSDSMIIPRTPEWKVVRRSLERIKPLIAKPPQRMPANLMQDRERLLDFAGILSDFLPNVKGALICAALFATDVYAPMADGTKSTMGLSPEKYSETLKKVSRLMGLSASRVADLEKINFVINSAPQSLTIDLEDDWSTIVTVIRNQLKVVKPTNIDDTIDSMWAVYRDRFVELFRDGTGQFPPQFGDILTSLHDADPGRSLSPNLMALTARDWAKLLLRSILQEDSKKLPDWMRVAAAVRLGLVELAEKLAQSISTGDSVPLQWVRQIKDQMAVQGAIRHGALVIAVAEGTAATADARPPTKSLTTDWKLSARHGALICTFDDFAKLMDTLRKDQITNPADFPIDSLYVELAGLPPGLAEVAVTERPLSAILKMKGNLNYSSTLEEFLNKLDPCYFVPQPLNVSSSAYRVIVDPRGLDDLIERSSGAPIRTVQ